MHEPPAALSKLGADSGATDLDHRLGAFLRVMAASKPSGVFLQSGSGSPGLSLWLLEGMDITSRLITVVTDPAAVERARRHVGDDIRVAIHRQDPLEFFNDIRSHEIHCVVFDEVPGRVETLRAALGLIAVGGWLVVLGKCPRVPWPDADGSAGPDVLGLLAGHAEFESTDLDSGPGAIVAVRRALVARSGRRGVRRGQGRGRSKKVTK